MLKSKIFRKAVACVAAFAMATPAFANMQQVMDKMFTTMTNVTPGGVYETQSRTVIAGGSLYLRTMPQTTQLVAFTPPRLKAGCNGIDAYMGSFSFINKDALVNMLRNIAAQAVPFAFNMAIQAICPSCAHNIAVLQKMADEMNKFNINACKVGNGEFGLQAMSDRVTQMENLASTLRNPFLADPNEASANPTKSGSSLRKAQDPTGAESQERNFAYKTATDAAIGTWFVSTMNGTGQAEFAEVLQSLTGTEISRFTAGQNADGSPGDETIKSTPYDRTMSFDNFMTGGIVTVLRCDAAVLPASKCLGLTPVQNLNFVGMRFQVYRMMFGPGAGVPGVIDKLSSKTLGLTMAEKAFLQSLPGGTHANLISLSQSPESARMYGTAMVDYIALEMTHSLISELINTLRQASYQDTEIPATQAFLDRLEDLRVSMNVDRARISDQLGNIDKSIQIAKGIRESINRSLNTRSLALN